MTHRTSKKGSYRIDRVFAGIGRIALASGTTNRELFGAYGRTLTDLYQDGHHDILKGLRDRRYTIQQVYDASRHKRLGTLETDVLLGAPLWERVAEWAPSSAKAPSSRKRYQVSFNTLESTGILGRTATVADLGDVDWLAASEAWPAGDADWNRLRAAVSRFLTVTLGDKHHPTRRRVMERFPKRAEPPRIPDVTVGVLWQLVEASPDHIKPCWVCLVATMMRVGEYLACTEQNLMPHTKSLLIPGTKTDESRDVVRIGDQAWEWVRRAIPAPVKYKALLRWWHHAREAVGVPDLRIHDLRHLPAQSLIDTGRSEVSVQASMRHADPKMTRRYAMQRDRGENARALDVLLFPPTPERGQKGA